MALPGLSLSLMLIINTRRQKKLLRQGTQGDFDSSNTRNNRSKSRPAGVSSTTSTAFLWAATNTRNISRPQVKSPHIPNILFVICHSSSGETCRIVTAPVSASPQSTIVNWEEEKRSDSLETLQTLNINLHSLSSFLSRH